MLKSRPCRGCLWYNIMNSFYIVFWLLFVVDYVMKNECLTAHVEFVVLRAVVGN